jgi:hypothetical protein
MHIGLLKQKGVAVSEEYLATVDLTDVGLPPWHNVAAQSRYFPVRRSLHPAAVLRRSPHRANTPLLVVAYIVVCGI